MLQYNESNSSKLKNHSAVRNEAFTELYGKSVLITYTKETVF